MASSPRAGTAALRAAVRDTKSILALAKVSLSPSPSDGVANPDLPRMHQLDDKNSRNSCLAHCSSPIAMRCATSPSRTRFGNVRADTNFEWFPLAVSGRRNAGTTQFTFQGRRQKKDFKLQFWESAPSREARAGSRSSCATRPVSYTHLRAHET